MQDDDYERTYRAPATERALAAAMPALEARGGCFDLRAHQCDCRATEAACAGKGGMWHAGCDCSGEARIHSARSKEEEDGDEEGGGAGDNGARGGGEEGEEGERGSCMLPSRLSMAGFGDSEAGLCVGGKREPDGFDPLQEMQCVHLPTSLPPSPSLSPSFSV